EGGEVGLDLAGTLLLLAEGVLPDVVGDVEGLGDVLLDGLAGDLGAAHVVPVAGEGDVGLGLAEPLVAGAVAGHPADVAGGGGVVAHRSPSLCVCTLSIE